jgi:hypothetical protein
LAGWEFIAFWLADGHVLAGMNVSIRRRRDPARSSTPGPLG